MLQTKKAARLTMATLLIGVMVTACANKKSRCEAPPDTVGSIDGPTADLAVEVYIDGTVSMEGYVLDGALSHFQQSIPMLERAVIKQGGKISFFKFGSDVVELPGRSYGDADRRNFYKDGTINKTTEIGKVLDRSQTDRLTVVVTDLFQERADINQLTEKIKAKFLTADLAVGVMGIRSSYKGRIFDVGINNYSFDYSSSSETPSLRPFYLLALGKPADISRYFDTLSQGEMSAFPEVQRLVFSRHLGASIASWRNAEVTDTQGVNEVTGVLVKSDVEDDHFKEFRVKSKGASHSITAILPFEPRTGTLFFRDLKAAVETSFICASVPGESALDSSKNGTSSSPPASAITVSEAGLSDNKIKIKMDIDPTKLDPGAINGLRLVLRPGVFELPAWVKEWSLTGEQVEIFRKEPVSFTGGKTYNLLPFIETLWEANRTVHNPKIADLYTYFKLD